MSKLFATVVLATLGVMLNVPTPTGSRLNCCEKHAYCCHVKSTCCRANHVSDQVHVAVIAAENTVAQSNCCMKHAYCCSQHQNCCRNSSSNGTVAGGPAMGTKLTADANSCCAKHAYCCSVRRGCCTEFKADLVS